MNLHTMAFALVPTFDNANQWPHPKIGGIISAGYKIRGRMMDDDIRQSAGRAAVTMLVALILSVGTGGATASAATRVTMHQRFRAKFRVNFNRTPVRRAFAAMAQALHLNAEFEPTSVASVGTQPPTTVSLQLRRAESARWILDQMAHNASSGPLDWTVSHGCLLVGSPNWTSRHTVCRIYNVAPLVLQRLQPHIWHVNQRLLMKIVRLLENSVDRNDWVANGGTVGNVSRFRSCLIIDNTRRNQWAIEKILTKLERAAANNARNAAR